MSIDFVELEKSYLLKDKLLTDKIITLLKGWGKFKVCEAAWNRHVDYYYDTDTLVLYRVNKTLRIRKAESVCFIVIKLPTFDELGRLEHIHYIKETNIEPAQAYILKHLPELTPDWNSLSNVLVVANNRKQVLLSAGEVEMEMVFDALKYIAADGTTSREYQMEIELKSDYTHRPYLDLLVEYLEGNVPGLIPVTDSKYRRGLFLTGISIPPSAGSDRLSMFRDI